MQVAKLLVALMPIVFVANPAILIVGGALQPQFPGAGRWLACVGIAEIWVVLMTYQIHILILLRHPLEQPRRMVVVFTIATVLLAWTTIELLGHARTILIMKDAAPQVNHGWGC